MNVAREVVYGGRTMFRIIMFVNASSKDIYLWLRMNVQHSFSQKTAKGKPKSSPSEDQKRKRDTYENRVFLKDKRFKR